MVGISQVVLLVYVEFIYVFVCDVLLISGFVFEFGEFLVGVLRVKGLYVLFFNKVYWDFFIQWQWQRF